MRDLLAGAKMLLRRMVRNPWGTSLPLVSLAIGLAGFLVLAGIADHELSYDRWVPARARIFRFETTIASPGAPPVRTVSLSARAGSALASHLAGLDTTSRVFASTAAMTVGDRHFSQKLVLAEPGFLALFPLQPVGGNIAEAVTRPDRVALSRSTAIRLFGRADPVGQTVKLPGGRSLAVAAVFQDLPRNSHLELEALASLQSPLFLDVAAREKDWLDLGGYFYARTSGKASAEELSRAATRILAAQAPMLKDAGLAVTIRAYPLKALHVRDAPADALPIGGFKPLIDYSRVLIVLAVAHILLLLAAFNYAFYLAMSVSLRTRELALRQFLGATPARIFRLFAGEALLSTLLALGLALAAVEVARPWWSNFAEGDPGFGDVAASAHAPFIYGLLLPVSAAVALFPFALARSVRPAETLRNRAAASAVRARLVAPLMSIQIALATALMLGALAISKQVALLNAAPLGFDPRPVLVVRSIPPSAPPAQLETLVRELGRVSGAAGAAAAQDEVGVGLVRAQANVQAASLPREISMDYMAAGPSFFQLMGVTPTAGRLLDGREGDRLTRSTGPGGAAAAATPALVNEAAARTLGYARPADAVGKTLTASLDVGWSPAFVIAGVLPNVPHASLREGPKPYLYFHQPEQETILYVRAAGGIDTARMGVEDRLRREFPETAPVVSALSGDIAKHYEGEVRLRTVFLSGSALVLAIALMGVAALSGSIVASRRREMALRKLFGARRLTVAGLIAWQLSWPLAVGYALAAAGSSVLILRWINGFSLRAPPNLIDFGAVFVVLTLACAVTASTDIARLTRLRPAAVLGSE
ncbi:MAG: ABC transporter permease [Alphaproteobacteria bacterium]|nr:ABC transporter permease [Alphaproteobacteria bacterium]